MDKDHGWNVVGRMMSRREAVRLGLAGTAGMLVGKDAMAAAAAPAAASPKAVAGKAKSVIQIWMWGGPTHVDTFDPKPEAGSDVCGPLDKPLETNVKGMRISELMPLLAKQADKYSLIRSMTHGNSSHETAAYMVQTGHKPGDGLNWPSMGSVVSCFKGYDGGYKGLIPPYIVLTELQGRFSEVGFLPNKCKPFATGGDPGQQRFAVEGVVAQGISEQRQKDRRELLGNLNTFAKSLEGDSRIAAMGQCEKEAYDLILGDAGKVFDLSQEKNEVRDRYGRTTFGQACLAARRLAERGVPYITINYRGWDTHRQNFQIMRRKLPEMDKGLASLLDDLSSSGLLESTVVWACGEFGRTPKVAWEAPWSGGRHHYGPVFSALVAGGGFKGGQVVGSSTPNGAEVKDRPVYPVDLIGAIYELLGIDPMSRLPNPRNKTIYALASDGTGMASGGRLKEIL